MSVKMCVPRSRSRVPVKCWKDADALLGPRTSRKVANNTYLLRQPDTSIGLRLHSTVIIEYRPDGSAQLRTGGWYSVTTKQRINHFMPARFSLFSERGIWYVQDMGVYTDSAPMPETRANETEEDYNTRWQVWARSGGYLNPGPRYAYQDGCTYHADGTITGALEDPRILSRQITRVNRFVAAYVAALAAGKVPKPGPGDCWYCHLRPEKGEPWENWGGADHVEGHIRESYFVPSLLWNAVQFSGWTAARIGHTLAPYWGQEAKPVRREASRYQLDDLKRVLRRYVRYCLGLPGGNRPAVTTTAPGSLYGPVR